MPGSPGQGLNTREARRLVLPVVQATVIRADARYHSEANLKPLAEAKIGPFSPRGTGIQYYPQQLAAGSLHPA